MLPVRKGEEVTPAEELRHAATLIREWATSDEAVEPVAKAIATVVEYPGYWRSWTEEARAALGAVFGGDA